MSESSNNNLSNIKVGFKKRDSNTVQLEGFTEENAEGIAIQATKDGKFYASGKFDGTWNSAVGLVTKDDLGVFLTASGTKAAVYKNYVEITNLKLYAGHTYLVLGKTGSSESISLISARIVSPPSEYGSTFSFLDSRTTGSNGGGCVTAAIITLTKDYTVSLQGYGYDNATYNYIGHLMAIQLK